MTSMVSITYKVIAAALLAVGMFAGASQAAVVVHGSRVIYPSDKKEITVQLENKGATPALAQIWMDAGNGAGPNEAKVPFLLTPPVARIEAGKGQAIRVIANGVNLSQDKESMFWLNLVDVPPKSSTDDHEQSMRVAIKTRLKFFYRPHGLPGDAKDAPQQLRWFVAPGKEGVLELHASNPTPYYVNFQTISLKQGDGTVVSSRDRGGMVAPGETASFPMNGLKSTTGDASVVFVAISDLGAPLPHTQPLGAGP